MIPMDLVAAIATVAFVGVHVPEGLASSQRAMDVAERLGMRPVRATAALLRAQRPARDARGRR